MSQTTAYIELREQARRRAWLQAGVQGVALATLAAAWGRWGIAAHPLVVAASVLAAVLLWHRLRAPAFNMDIDDLAAHLNRCFPPLEESAALVLRGAPQQDVLAHLQRARVTARWSKVVSESDVWLPRLRWRGALVAVLIGAALLLNPPAGSESAAMQIQTDSEVTSVRPAQPPVLESVQVTPPPYTGLAMYESSSLDVELPEGSRVEWTYQYAGDAALRVMINDMASAERQISLDPVSAGMRTGGAVINTTALYRVEVQDGSDESLPTGVHTLAVVLDAAPTLRQMAPAQTRIEIPRDGDPRLDYRVTVRDDYGVADVSILASVAKGSGEGVKFRDEVFTFDRATANGDAIEYERHWDLRALGMEPGDEIYLFTRVIDNRPVEANEGRSETLVIRWLDDQQVLAAEEGLAISVMPEYFKSQRQIIIDTEQLIADRGALSEDEFDQASRDLGQAQSDLKERYGQYLGDEYGEGEAPEGMVGPAESDADDAEQDDDGHEGHDHEGHDHAEHAHESPAQMETAGSAADLISRFGHNHGAAEVGLITRESPVGLMRRSLANMWDAELRLRLSDPEGALPFEREALRYFDLARQADRIYTRRLGFEPPPVSEDRRLSGELDDIQSRERQQTAAPDDSAATRMQALFQMLSTTPQGMIFEPEQRALLQRGARNLTTMAKRRPALINAAANLERLRLQGVYDFEDCADCRQDLLAAIWSTIPDVEAQPGTATRRSVSVNDSEGASR